MAGKEILAIKPRDRRERGELRVSPVIAGARQRGAISIPTEEDCKEAIAGALKARSNQHSDRVRLQGNKE